MDQEATLEKRNAGEQVVSEIKGKMGKIETQEDFDRVMNRVIKATTKLHEDAKKPMPLNASFPEVAKTFDSEVDDAFEQLTREVSVYSLPTSGIEIAPMGGDIIKETKKPQQELPTPGIAVQPNKQESVRKAPPMPEMDPNMALLNKKIDSIFDLNPKLEMHKKFTLIETDIIEKSNKISDMFGMINWAEKTPWKTKDNGLWEKEVNQIKNKAIARFIAIAEEKMGPAKWDEDLQLMTADKLKDLSTLLGGEIQTKTFRELPKINEPFKKDEIKAEIKNLINVKSQLDKYLKVLHA